MLADEADHVIGVDTHRDTHTAAVVETATGVVGESKTTSADSLGHKRMLVFGEEHAPGSRVWAIESTGSYGSGLTTYLLERGERVVEVDRPKRPARRSGAKSDELDAIRAAKEALERNHPTQPRRRGEREAVRVLQRTREGAVRGRSRAICHLKALVVTAPEGLRSQLRRLADAELITRCARLRTAPAQSTEHRMTVKALRSTARRVLALEAEAHDLESELELLVERVCPELLAEPGVGVFSAAELINAWSHAGWLRSEAAFAMLGGAAPIPDAPLELGGDLLHHVDRVTIEEGLSDGLALGEHPVHRAHPDPGLGGDRLDRPVLRLAGHDQRVAERLLGGADPLALGARPLRPLLNRLASCHPLPTLTLKVAFTLPTWTLSSFGGLLRGLLDCTCAPLDEIRPRRRLGGLRALDGVDNQPGVRRPIDGPAGGAGYRPVTPAREAAPPPRLAIGGARRDTPRGRVTSRTEGRRDGTAGEGRA